MVWVVAVVVVVTIFGSRCCCCCGICVFVVVLAVFAVADVCAFVGRASASATRLPHVSVRGIPVMGTPSLC